MQNTASKLDQSAINLMQTFTEKGGKSDICFQLTFWTQTDMYTTENQPHHFDSEVNA